MRKDRDIMSKIRLSGTDRQVLVTIHTCLRENYEAMEDLTINHPKTEIIQELGNTWDALMEIIEILVPDLTKENKE